MRHAGWGIVATLALLFLGERPAFAQAGGTGGQTQTRPQRKLRRSRAPALSPALNLVPGLSASFGGQFLLRQTPQEQAFRQQQQTRKSLDKLQAEIVDQESQIKMGSGKTGHRSQFMNYGTYYSLGRGAAGGGRR